MKNFGSILEFTHERNADLMRAYRELIASAGSILLRNIFESISDSPASRFWVSDERAAIVISAMLAGRKLPKMRPNKKEMFDEIFRRFLILRNQKPELGFHDIIHVVIRQPAPKFYLTPQTVKEYFFRIKKGFYDNRSNNS